MICGSRFLLILQFGTILRFLPATHGHVFFVVVNFEQYSRKCGKAGIRGGTPKKNRTGFGELFLIVVVCFPAKWV